ncbi:MAG: MBL fold metallo-hydrolase [Solirubrobacteraceae bacterium]
MGSRVTTLGGCGGWPEPGRACSGFVVEHDDFRVVLDLGYGTLPRLLGLLDSAVADGLDAVVITHEHADHMVDLHGLFRARWFGRRDGPRIALYAPQPVLGKVVALEDPEAAEDLKTVFDWSPLPAAPYRVGPFALESVALPHHVLTAGVRLSAPGLTVAYTADTGPDPALTELGRDADVFIVDATHPTPPPTVAGRPRYLLSATEAGEIAAAAGARHLLLSHFWPGTDRDIAVGEARRSFAGEIHQADEGTVIELG